ncbi:MFS transporter [Rugamonas sp.]|uniref:MFS transporter n=1 Tax=Rugamonas sp. TaxID=1926287 RepID=UPI0025FCB36B|nr:MFS transporter [Rugamonas sp.]
MRAAAAAAADAAPVYTLRLQWLLGIACGLLIANVYYAQPLTGLITAALGLPRASAGLLVTLPLIGYGTGLLLVVPLADLVENRRLVLLMVGLEALCMALISITSNAALYLVVAFCVGTTAAAVQILVPYVTFLAPEAQRGQAVGRVVSGVMLGIMLARPVSSLMSDLASWRAIFGLSAALMAMLAVALRGMLPARHPAPGLTYPRLLLSLGRIFVGTPILRRRAIYHAYLFGAFSVFWTAVPLWLSGPQFGLTQRGIAWVALAGVAGAIAPPLAGRMADRGLSRRGTGLAMLAVIVAFAVTALARGASPVGLGLIVFAAILLDFAVSANLVFGQRAIYALGAEQRGRINGLFMATFFVGGAVGSALSGWCYTRYGWPGVTALGMALPVIALLYFATEQTAPRQLAASR